VSTTLIDPVSIPKTQEDQLRDPRRLVQKGGAKLVGPDGRQIEIPESVRELLILKKPAGWQGSFNCAGASAAHNTTGGRYSRRFAPISGSGSILRCLDDRLWAVINAMANNPKDRHVLAAALKCGASVVVTYNKRDFPC
jgi:hypothetical protein